MARLARLLVAFVVAASVLLTLAQRAGSIGPWWLELSRYLPYPALLLPAGAALLLSCRLGRWWVLASAAALALVATLGMGFEWHRGDRGDAVDRDDMPLRLMTYNVKALKAAQRNGGFAELAREVARHDPDILVMQDATGLLAAGSGVASPRGTVFGLREVHAVGQYVIASRFPLRQCALGHIDFRAEDEHYLRCIVQAGGIDLNLVTAHFESPRDGLNAARREGVNGVGEWRRNYEDRLTQARALARDLRAGPRPLIVAGDLNAPELSPVIRTLLAVGLRDAFSSAGRGYGYSYGQALRVGFSFLRIDHILVSPELGVSDCFVGGGQASDHRPVIADLRLRRPPDAALRAAGIDHGLDLSPSVK